MLNQIIMPLLLSFSTSITMQATSADEVRQQIDDAIPGDLVNDPLSFQWTTYGEGLKVKSIDAEGAPGGVAIKAQLKRAKANRWDAGINVPITSSISKGDKVRIFIWVRSDKETDITTRLQQDFEPYNGFGEWNLKTGSEWKLDTYETIAAYDLEAGKSTLIMQLGAKAQSVEIGQIYITKETI